MRPTSIRPRPRIVVGGAVSLLTALAATAFVGLATVSADHAPVHGTVLARAPFAHPTDVKISTLVAGRHQVIQVKEAADTVIQQIVIQPGGFTGWHTHFGPAVAIVAEGTLTLYQGSDPSCGGRQYGPGQTFVDPGQGNVHAARNEGMTTVVVFVTYFDVPPGRGPATPAPNPGHCSDF